MTQAHFLFFKPQDCGECDKDEPVYANTFKHFSDTQGEEIHYGEIDFSKPCLRDPSEWAEQDQEQNQDPEYVEVRHAQDRHQTAPDSDELYAQVRRK